MVATFVPGQSRLKIVDCFAWVFRLCHEHVLVESRIVIIVELHDAPLERLGHGPLVFALRLGG